MADNSSCVLLLRSLSLHAFYVKYSYLKTFTLVIIVEMSHCASSFSKMSIQDLSLQRRTLWDNSSAKVIT